MSHRLVVGPEDAGQRADVILGRRLDGVSRRVARQLGLEGRLYIDGVRSPPSTRAPAGAQLELRVEASPVPVPPLHCLAVTDRVIYVAKPPGVHTHRLRPDDPPALADAVVAAYPECAAASEDSREGGAAHRLDRETTGVVAFARSRDVWLQLREAFAARAVGKEYEALCTAKTWPPAPLAPTTIPSPHWRATGAETFELFAPLGPGPTAGTMAVRPDGQGAHSTISIRRHVERGEPDPDGIAKPNHAHDKPGANPNAQIVWPHRALCHVCLRTGRRHQARIHLAHAGLPIVGDTRYGGADLAPTTMLHAARLDLSGALVGEVPVEAPRPVGFVRTLEALELDAPPAPR